MSKKGGQVFEEKIEGWHPQLPPRVSSTLVTPLYCCIVSDIYKVKLLHPFAILVFLFKRFSGFLNLRLCSTSFVKGHLWPLPSWQTILARHRSWFQSYKSRSKLARLRRAQKKRLRDVKPVRCVQRWQIMGARRQVQGGAPPAFWLKFFLQRCAIAVIKINAVNAGIKSHNTEV